MLLVQGIEDRMMSSIRRVLAFFSAALMALAWLIPNKYPPWVSFYNESCMGLALVFFVLAQPHDPQHRGMPLVSWFFVAVTVIPWVQFAFGLLYFSGDAWVSSLYMLGMAVAVSTGYIWTEADARRFATLLSSATLIAAIISSAIGLDQVLGGYPLGIWAADETPDFRAIGNIAQPNNLATLIGFGAVSLLVLREQRLLGKVSTTLVLILLLLGGAATQSRTSLLFGPMLICGLYYFRKHKNISFATKPSTVAVMTALYALLMYYFYFVPAAIWQVDINSLADRGIESGRFAAWQILIDGLNHQPWFGYGWLQVAAAQYNVAVLHPALQELFAQAHNLFLDLLIFCGYPLGVILCAAIVYWFVTRLRKTSTVESACGMLLVSVLGIHSMLELPHYYSYFLIPAAMWIGLIEHSIGFRSWLSFRWRGFVCALTLCVFVAVCWDYPEVEADFRLARFEYLRVGSIHASLPAPDARFLSNLTEYIRFYRQIPSRSMNNETLSEMQHITCRYPFGKLLYGYAEALALNGRGADAVNVFLRIRQIFGERAYEVYKQDMKNRLDAGDTRVRDFYYLLPVK